MLMMLLSLLESEDDRAYFLSLHAAYETKMYQVALNLLHSHALAEEAVQESWVRVIKYFEKIKSISGDKTGSYIVIIVKNTSLGILRKENQTAPFPEDWDAPASMDELTDEFHRLVALIRSMPEQYRELLELKFVLEWSNQEIARQTGMKESTVASRIFRGREQLISKLREESYPL